MPTITIKNIPEELYEALKSTAENHHRSINSEVIIRLEQALLPRLKTPKDKLTNIQRLRAQISPNVISADDIDDIINNGRA
ncbi:DNA-binding protein [Leucothrix arctica]|uniref:DNA-binding protein n=2 Tax=Leucothrix arctica TaxID=1481894 RepID=A0A317C6S2_9GAMM|nr:DNA-binding protein [Leucothrix arctica]